MSDDSRPASFADLFASSEMPGARARHYDVGDEVEVLLERLENDEGMVVLSKEKAAH